MAMRDDQDPWYVSDWLNPQDAQPADQPQMAVPRGTPAAQADPVYDSGQGVTDPPVQSPTPAPTNPIPTNPNGTQVGGGTPWAPGSSAPSGAPAGYTWDPSMASYEASPGSPATGAQAPQSGRARIDAALQAAKSTDDPNYWYGKIESDPNGLTSAWDYWVDRINRGDGAGLGLPKFQDNQPGSNGSGTGQYNMSSPTAPNNPYNAGTNINIGTDPLSLQVDSTLQGILNNKGRDTSPTGQKGLDALNAYFDRGGNANARLESIREKMGLLQRAQMADARGDLASRGLLSEGSTAQGPELSTLGRISSNIAVQYSAAARDALIADDQEMMTAIQTATGLDESAANRVLAATQTITQRQQMLADIALKSLDQNISWNKFLAQYGLDRDRVAAEIQNGQIANLIPLINAFNNMAGTSAQGYV